MQTKPLLPIALDWIAIHIATDNTRFVVIKTNQRFGVVIFDANDTMHQMPICETEDAARQLQMTCVREYWRQQDTA